MNFMTDFKIKHKLYTASGLATPSPQYETFRLPGCYNVTAIHFLELNS
jgi:hypothetical protein